MARKGTVVASNLYKSYVLEINLLELKIETFHDLLAEREQAAKHTLSRGCPRDVVTRMDYRGIGHQIHPQCIPGGKDRVRYRVPTKLINERRGGSGSITYLKQ